MRRLLIIIGVVAITVIAYFLVSLFNNEQDSILPQWNQPEDGRGVHGGGNGQGGNGGGGSGSR